MEKRFRKNEPSGELFKLEGLLYLVVMLFIFMSSARAYGPEDNLQEIIQNTYSQGGVVELSPGIYRQSIILDNINASEDNPLVIRPAIEGTVVFSGTRDLDGLSWELIDEDLNIYRSEALSEDIWQLFVGEKMMVNARWPNADHPFENFENSSWWKRHESWCKSVKEGSGFEQLGEDEEGNGIFRGWLTENGFCNMTATGIDFNNKLAVLNVNSMTTYAGTVKNYDADAGYFEYQLDSALLTTFGSGTVSLIHKNRGHAYFYFENDLAFLDQPGEWYYDKSTKNIYLIPESGANPEGLHIEGKVRDYSFDISDSRSVYIQGLQFFASTITMDDCVDSRIENNNFDYASYSHRMLGDLGEVPHTRIIQNSISNTTMQEAPETLEATNNRFINNRVAHTDGMALEMIKGIKDSIVNNDFLYIDISGTIGGSVCVDYRKGYNTYFIRNTLKRCGASAATKNSKRPFNAFNELSEWGYLQDDGTGFQIAAGGQEGSITRNNWIHDSEKSGMRFDGAEDMVGDDTLKLVEGSFARNVVWNNPLGYMVKGDRHRVVSNVAFNNSASGAKILEGQVYHSSNQNTLTINNAMEDMLGMRNGNYLTDPVPGLESNNWVGTVGNFTIDRVLRDPYNMDFRPKDTLDSPYGFELISQGLEHSGGVTRYDSYVYPSFTEEYAIDVPEIGAYEHNALEYWIPGRQQDVPSHPIPPDGSVSARASLDLMWLKPYGSDEQDLCDVYMGGEGGSLIKVLEGTSHNIAANEYLKIAGESLNPLVTYSWQVRCSVNGEEKVSPVWTFKPAGIPYQECTENYSHFDDFATPMGPEDYDDPSWKPASPSDFLGHVQLEDNHLLLLPHVLFSENHPDDSTAVAADIDLYSHNQLKTPVNIKIRPFPFIRFDYFARNRRDSIQFFTKLVPFEVGKKSSDGLNVLTLAPAQDEYKTVLIPLQDHIDNIDDKIGDDEYWETLEQFRFLINPESEWDSIQDGELHIDNFHAGYSAVKEYLDSVKIVGQPSVLEMSAGEKRIFTEADVSLTAMYEGQEYPMTQCMDLRSDWNLVFEDQGEHDGYIAVENVIELDGTADTVYVPVRVQMGVNYSDSYLMMVVLQKEEPTTHIPESEVFSCDVPLVFPTHFSDELYVQNHPFINKVEVVDLNGNVLLQNSRGGKVAGASTLAQGVYVVRIRNINGLTRNTRVFKR